MARRKSGDDVVSAFADTAVGALSVSIECDATDTEGLSLSQKAALHVYGHTILTAGFRLYEVVEKDKADKVIKRVIKKVLAKLGEG